MSICLIRSYRKKICLLYFYLCVTECWVYEALGPRVSANQNDERRTFTTFPALTWLSRITCISCEDWLVCLVSCGELIGSAMTGKTLSTLTVFTCRSSQYTNLFFHPSLLASLPSPTVECNIALILSSFLHSRDILWGKRKSGRWRRQKEKKEKESQNVTWGRHFVSTGLKLLTLKRKSTSPGQGPGLLVLGQEGKEFKPQSRNKWEIQHLVNDEGKKPNITKTTTYGLNKEYLL